mgnify:CR=1 FL=1
MAALLTKAIIEKPSVLCTLLGRVPAVLKRLKPGGARVAGTDDDTPGSLTRSEIKGFLEGPFLYLSSRRRNRLGAPKAPTQSEGAASDASAPAQASSEGNASPEGSPGA